jgi:hypothetical protein
MSVKEFVPGILEVLVFFGSGVPAFAGVVGGLIG